MQIDAGDPPLGSVIESIIVTKDNRPDIGVERHPFLFYQPTRLSRLEVRTPPEMEIEYQVSSWGKKIDWAPEEKTEDGCKILSWEAKNPKKLAKYMNRPDHSTLAKRVLVRLNKWMEDGKEKRALENAVALSKYSYEITKEAAKTDKEITTLAKKF